MINYLKISKNNNSKNTELLHEIIFKQYHSGDFDNILDEVKDILKECVEELQSYSVIESINDEYKVINGNDCPNNYDHIIIDQDENELSLLIYNNLINSSHYMSKYSEEEINKNINLLGSLLNKTSDNSSIFVGDIYLIKVDYDSYLKLNNNKLDSVEDFYKNYRYKNLIKTFANIFFIKIFSITDLKHYIYNRDLINYYLNVNKDFEIEDKKYIRCKHENNIFYIKFIDSIYENHYSILNKLSNDINNFFIVSLNEDDINYIKKKKS